MTDPSGLIDEEFVGYLFNGSAPERRPRLWFLDRQLYTRMFSVVGHGHVMSNDSGVGYWIAQMPRLDPEVTRQWGPFVAYERAAPGVILRYDHLLPEQWSMTWRLTDTTIPHVHTFGYLHDTWRLGVWPD